MNEQQKEFVKSKVLQFINGNTPEKNKLEFKSRWYNLKDKKDREYQEFLKDTCGIVNSYGGDDGFIVIGIDEGTKELYNTSIEDSGKNQNEIKDIIISNIADRFVIDIDYIEVNGKQLSVIFIPPSINKPHVIIRYQTQKNPSKDIQIFENEIFIRNGSGSNVATKADLDRMYWERGSILLNQKLIVTIDMRTFSMSLQPDLNSKLYLDIGIHVNFENEGLRPISIYDLKAEYLIEKFKEMEVFQNLSFTLKRDFYNSVHTSINPNTSKALNVEFKSNQLPLNTDFETLRGVVRSVKFSEVVLKNFKVKGRNGMIDHDLHFVNDNE